MLASSFMKLMLGGEHRVGGVLGELGAAHVHEQGALVVAVEGLVDLAHALLCARRAGADEDAVGLEEVGDRRAFLEEFGVGDDVEGDPSRRARRGPARCLLLHLVGGADGDGGFVHDDPVARHVAGDLLGDREHVLQVGRAVLVGRGADGDELHLGVATASAASVVKRSRPSARLRSTIGCRPGSQIGMSPARAGRSWPGRRPCTARRGRPPPGRRR
jgi:hypothetical protein